MKITAITGAATFALLLAALVAVAQEPAPGSGEPRGGTTAGEAVDGEGSPTRSGAGADDPGADAADNGAGEPVASPSDYRASEQISEDRSVSFPVDI